MLLQAAAAAATTTAKGMRLPRAHTTPQKDFVIPLAVRLIAEFEIDDLSGSRVNAPDYAGTPNLSYEEANWARMSPRAREAQNRLREARRQADEKRKAHGLDELHVHKAQTPIPEPEVDLYVPPQPQVRETISITRLAGVAGLLFEFCTEGQRAQNLETAARKWLEQQR
jgi:hypothetical protein